MATKTAVVHDTGTNSVLIMKFLTFCRLCWETFPDHLRCD